MCLAIPAQVVAFRDPERFLADVEVSGVRRAVNVALVSGGPDGVEIGDWVLVHVGFALSRIDEDEAHATLRFFEQMSEEYQQELDDFQQSAIE